MKDWAVEDGEGMVFRVATFWVTSSEYGWKEGHLSHSIEEYQYHFRRKREVYPVLRSFAKIHHFLTVSSGFTGWWFPIVMALTVSIQDGRYQETRRGGCSTLGRLWSKEGANMLQTMVNLEIYTNIYSVVVWNHGILWLSIHLGMASSQLTNFTNIFQRGRYTTNQYIYIYISII